MLDLITFDPAARKIRGSVFLFGHTVHPRFESGLLRRELRRDIEQ